MARDDMRMPVIPVHSRTFPYIPVHSRTFPYIPVHSRTFPYIAKKISRLDKMHTRSGARHEGVQLKNLPPGILYHIFLLAHNQTNYPYKYRFGNSNLNPNGKRKTVLPGVGRNYYHTYKALHPTYTNAVNAVSQSVRVSSKRRQETRAALSRNSTYPDTRSIRKLRNKVASSLNPTAASKRRRTLPRPRSKVRTRASR